MVEDGGVFFEGPPSPGILRGNFTAPTPNLVFSRTFEEKPSNNFAEPVARSGVPQYFLGTMDALREEIRTLREKWRDQPRAPYYDALSDLLLKAGKIAAAMNLMESSLADDAVGPQRNDVDGAWWFRRGMEYADASLFEESVACLNRALAAGAEGFETHYCLAGVYKSLERPDMAEAHCRHSLRRNPGFAPTFLLLASVLRMTGRLEDSADSARMAVLLDPDCAPAHYDLACYYALAGQKDKALAALETALTRGFCDFDWAVRDPDLEALREAPEFGRLLRGHGEGGARTA
jgi:tetratricopeptide (TPR) repeat protein